jgi:hypothetical protein
MSSQHRDPPCSPECFVVCIYRRHPSVASRMAGTVERVGSGCELGFADLRELQAIFAQPPGQALRRKS